MKRHVLTMFAIVMFACPASAQWRWTPEARRLVRVRDDVAATPEEMLLRADQFFRAGEYAKAQAAYERFLDYWPETDQIDRIQFSIAECHEARGRLKTAGEEYRKLIANHRDSEYYDRVVQKEYNIAEQFYARYVERSGFGRIMAGRHLQRAIEVYEWIIENDPFGEGTAEAQYKLAECRFIGDELDDARFEYQRVLDQFPTSKWADLSQFYVATCDYRQSKTAKYDQEGTKRALKGYRNFLRRAPSSDLADDARSIVEELRSRLAEHQYLIAEFYERRGRGRAALLAYRRLLSEYPETSWAEMSRVAVANLVEDAAIMDGLKRMGSDGDG